jgi:arabinose-5-phosphate isomerase
MLNKPLGTGAWSCVLACTSRVAAEGVILYNPPSYFPPPNRIVKEDGSMSSHAAHRARPVAALRTEEEILQFGREVVSAEARALVDLVEKLDSSFFRAVDLIFKLNGNLIITGMGKAGHIGQKLAATFASTGTRAHFLHPAEALHGDLGRLHPYDAVLVLSQSGETSEVVQMLPALKEIGVPVIAVTAHHDSTLSRAAEVMIALGSLDEACSLGLAPSTSTTVMLAVGDALALVVSRLKGFGTEDFARFHPSGALGLKLSHVEDTMRQLSDCRVARAADTIREILVSCTKPGRRTGAIMLTDRRGRLAGLFTDSDLARLIEKRNDGALDRPVSEVMATAPTTVRAGEAMTEAIEILAERKISELPVVDAEGCPVGMIDVTDVMGLLPEPKSTNANSSEDMTIRIYPVDEYAD